MTIDEAIEVLELHNQWRKGAEIPMETPTRIGIAIDLILCELKNLRKIPISSDVEREAELINIIDWMKNMNVDIKHSFTEHIVSRYLENN
jgi:hypothetical protein